MSGRWGGRNSPHMVARDFQVGMLSSEELSKFRRLPPSKQNDIVNLLDKIKFHQRQGNQVKASEFQQKLKALETSLGI